MKKTQLKDAKKNIQKRIVSYLSICLVIMLGVGAFLATRYMEAGIINEAAGYYQDRSFKDFELISSLGATEKNIDAIRETDGVTAAEGVMEFDGSLSLGDNKNSITALSLTKEVSVPLLADGRNPAAADECAVGEDFAEKAGLAIGDKVSIYLKNPGGDDPLKGHDYVITGLIKHPDYVHRKLTNTAVLPLSAFDMSVTGDAFTRVFVKAGDIAFDDVFTDEYFEQTSGAKAALNAFAEELETERAKEVRQKAYDEIDKEWESALAELDQAERDIDAGEAKLNSELAKGREKLEQGQKTLDREVRKAKDQLDSGEAKIKEGEEQLSEAKEALETARQLFEENTSWMDDALELTDYLLEHVDDEEKPDDYDEKEQALADTLIENGTQLKAIAEYAKTDEAEKAAKELKKQTGTDMMPLIETIRDTDIDSLLITAAMVKTGEGHFSKEELTALKEAFEAIRSDTIEETLDDAEDSIAGSEKQLKKKKKELKAGRKELSEKQAQGEQKLKNGWAEYYSKKNKYEGDLADARALLETNREEAEEKLAEAKAEVADIDCDCLVLDRKANAGYIDVKVQLDSLRSTGLVFGVLFILITALVCFSTLTIIIEEQKELIGTTKAFGFHKNEVLGKYLMFGLTAGILGDILAVITGFILSIIVQAVYSASNLYQYGHAGTIVRPVPTILISIAMIIVCAIASVSACTDILRSPASMLMKGQTAKSTRRKKQTSSSGRGGSLYSKLILRNIRDDKARVIISTAIVAFCCMLIGVGLSFKLATTGMLAKQQDEINLYDIRVDMGDSLSSKQRAKVIRTLDAYGVRHSEALYESHLFSTDGTITGMTVLAGDPDSLGEYYGMKTADGKPAGMSSDGLLIPVRMCENYGFSEGSSFTVLDSTMKECDAPVTGTYTCYFNRICVTTPEGYSRIFGCDADTNCSFVRLDGADEQKLMSALLAVSDDISFEKASDFRTSFESVGALYNIIVFVTTGVAIFMSFMILTNLASIFLNRKKEELIVMRINGFSIRQTRAYLAKEVYLTTLIGLAIGVAAGSLMAPAAVRILEPADLQFDRAYHAVAWAAAAGLEGLFAIIIYSFTFRKVKKLNLKDIA